MKMEDRKQEPATVLVIDDDDRVRALLRDVILFAGHRVIEAPDGYSGMKHVEKGGFDIVLTDLGMPFVNGWEMAKYVKEKTPRTPVILITGWGLELEEAKIKESGVDLVISKPFQIEDVIRAVDRFAGASRAVA